MSQLGQLNDRLKAETEALRSFPARSYHVFVATAAAFMVAVLLLFVAESLSGADGVRGSLAAWIASIAHAVFWLAIPALVISCLILVLWVWHQLRRMIREEADRSEVERYTAEICKRIEADRAWYCKS